MPRKRPKKTTTALPGVITPATLLEYRRDPAAAPAWLREVVEAHLPPDVSDADFVPGPGERWATPLDAVGLCAQQVEEAAAALDAAVRIAHRHGYSWAEIATRLGITRQAAHKRFSVSADEP